MPLVLREVSSSCWFLLAVGLLATGASGNSGKEEVLRRLNNGSRPSYTLFINPSFPHSAATRHNPAAGGGRSSGLTSRTYPSPHLSLRNSQEKIQDDASRSINGQTLTSAVSENSAASSFNNVTVKDLSGQRKKNIYRITNIDKGGLAGNQIYESDVVHDPQQRDDSVMSILGLNQETWSSTNRSTQWKGRRSTDTDDYYLQEEEVLEGVDRDDPEALLPDPTGPALTILEKRLQHSSIRHRKSRKNFVRTRKSPKMRPRSHTDNYEVLHVSKPPLTDSENEELQAAKDWTQDSVEATPTSSPWYSSGAPNLENKFRATGDLVPTNDINAYDQDDLTPEQHGAESVGEADVDVVTKFLRIVESQHLLGDNCTKGTSFNLGEGVVDRYAQERFRLEGEIAVNRANLYTRLWKYSAQQVLASEYLLHAEVLTMVELDEDIFAAGNCYDKYEYQDYILFCPFAYRLPEGNILVKDLAVEYKYLSNTSEWFFIARKKAELAINNYTHLTKGYHTYTHNSTAHTEREEEEILSVTYEDGRWSKPYFDCGGGNIWMMTYTVPFFGYANRSYYFKGTSGIDIDLRRVDIDQCPLPPGSTALNIFANSDKCKKRTTKCMTIPGLGFRRGSYRCECRLGFYFPDTASLNKYYNGSIIEEEFEKKIMGEVSVYDEEGSFECLPCAEGCETCVDDSPCVVTLHWVMRTAILTLAVFNIVSLPVIVVFTWKYSNLKVIRAASPVLLCIIILGACFIYSTTLVLYPIPTIVTCSLRVWLREIGFSLAYGALMLKTWRISVIFRVRSAKAVKITDLDLMKRLGVIVGVFTVFLAIRTVVAPPHVIVSMTADDLKAFLCPTDWWDHAFTAMEILFLVWGIRLCIMVRKAPSEFNESKYISLAIYNEFILSLFLNVSMLFLQSPANPDLLFIIFFCHTQLTITLLIVIIFGSKVYMVVKGQGKGAEETLSMTKPKAAKFMQRGQQVNSNNHGTLDQGDLQEQFQRLYTQLESLRERNLRLGNRQMVAKLTAMQEAAASTTPITATKVTAAVVTERNGSSAEQQQQYQQQQQQYQQQQLGRRSQRERNYNDGIVMKPYVNSILANDKLACADYQAEAEVALSTLGTLAKTPAKDPVKNVNLLRKSISKEEILDKGGGRRGKIFNHLKKSTSKDENINSVLRNRGKDLNVLRKIDNIEATVKKNRRRSESHLLKTGCKDLVEYIRCPDAAAIIPDDCSHRTVTSSASVDAELARRYTSPEDFCGSLTSSNPSDNATRSPSSAKDLKPFGHRSAEFLLRSSISTELCERVCRSLEYLDESGTRYGAPIGGSGGCGGPEEDLSLEDRSVRSAHSTPRRSQGRRFREVHDPDRARAFILYNLSDRATLTDEVTV
ncbi:uncharacterized protein [Procambarus clarkii]|uniref:uncharacterized protein n=1 Tax=Procambarus clarkii TaxID=6728 RepID=UPI003742BF31